MAKSESTSAHSGVHGYGDQPTDRDQLGFYPYVLGIAEFLTNEQTHPPLTLSIEGDWGSGKSSFMLQLEKAIKDRVAGAITIRFNAWRHDKEDALWAAFALAFTERIRTGKGWFKRNLAAIKLTIQRFLKKGDILGGIKALLLILFWSFLALALLLAPVLYHAQLWKAAATVSKAAAVEAMSSPEKAEQDKERTGKEMIASPKSYLSTLLGADSLERVLLVLMSGGGVWTLVFLLVLVVKKTTAFFGNPLEIKLREYLSTPAYEDRVSFIENFHCDFKMVVDAYAGRHNVYVFIDDLDRCEAPKAAELMQAINLLISDDNRLIFIIGMDREKVAAGIAVKFKDLLPYLPGGTTDGTVSCSHAVEFGNSFLEKFVQVSFRVPAPGNENLSEFYRVLFESDQVAGALPRTSAAWHYRLTHLRDWQETRGRQKEARLAELRTREEERHDWELKREKAGALLNGKYPSIQAIMRMVSPLFEDNPRRLKRFLNLFRLRAFSYYALGIIGEENSILGLEQLAKIATIIIRWPELLDEWASDKSLINRLHQIIVGDKTPLTSQETKWSSLVEIQYLFRFGVVEDKERFPQVVPNPALYSLENVPADLILRTLPRVPKTAEPATPILTGSTVAAPVVQPPEVALQTERQTEQVALAEPSVDQGQTARAEGRKLAQEYDAVRTEMPSGRPRTGRMSAIVEEMRKLVAGWKPSPDELSALFKNGDAGLRVLALALVQALPIPGGVVIVTISIQNSASAFEQYQALSAARNLVLSHQLSAESLKTLLESILQARDRSASERRITDFDFPRWVLAHRVIALIYSENYQRSGEDASSVERADCIAGIISLMKKWKKRYSKEDVLKLLRERTEGNQLLALGHEFSLAEGDGALIPVLETTIRYHETDFELDLGLRLGIRNLPHLRQSSEGIAFLERLNSNAFDVPERYQPMTLDLLSM